MGLVEGVTGFLWDGFDEKMSNEVKKLCVQFNLSCEKSFLLVNINTQRLHLISLEKVMSSYLVSTGKKGAGQVEGSGKTPLGLHYIAEKIGGEAKPLEIFKSRISTGELAEVNFGENVITSRILWLQGVEPGFNFGKDFQGRLVDSKERYIYIHGTNDYANIGRPESSGCVRMLPEDVMDLFGKIEVKTPVYIY